MKKLHITPKNKGLNGPRSLSEVSLVRVVSLGAVMASLLSSVSPVFASHLSSTGATVQSANASQSTSGVISASARDGRVVMTRGDRSCGVDQVVSRSSSTSGKKISAEEHYKKLTANQLSDGSGGYSFESSCGADASVSALTSTSVHSLIDADVGARRLFGGNADAAERWVGNFGKPPPPGIPMQYLCPNTELKRWWGVCIGLDNRGAKGGPGSDTAVKLGHYSAVWFPVGQIGYDPISDGVSENQTPTWISTLGAIGIGDVTKGRTRQITGVSAGTYDTDAVNVAQLKALRQWVLEDNAPGVNWLLSANGQGATRVSNYGLFHLSSDRNLKIAYKDSGIRGRTDIVFDTKDDFEVNSIAIRGSSLSEDGLNEGGPQITIDEINAGGKKIINVADGDVAYASLDAINGSQLYKMAKNISQYLGRGAYVLAGTAPTYSIQRKEHNDVGSAFASVDKTLTQLSGKLGFLEIVMQDPESKLITIGGQVELGNKVSIANSKGDVRVLSGVADGELSSSSTDAINGSQLYKVSQDIEGVNATVAKIDGNITTLDGNVSQYLGGGADVLKGTAPTYSIHGEKHNNVGSAFAGVDGSLTDLYKQIDGVESRVISREGGDKLVEQDPESQLITIGKDVEGDKISIANNEGDVRVLSGVADGELSSSSTDAINGSQLYKVSQDIEGVNATVAKIDGNITTFGGNVSQYLGGGADVLKGTAPTYSIHGEKHNNVGSAFAGVDGSLTDLYKQIDGVESRVISREGGDKLIKQDPESQLITIGKDVEGDKISIANNEGDARVLSGVADGELSSSSTDAINGSQLYKVSQDIEGVNAIVTKIDGNITTFDGNVSQYLGGGADVLKGTAPTYSIQKKEHNDVGSAFAGVDGSLTDLYKQIDEVESRVTSREGGDKLVEQDPESQLITIGKDVEGDKISIANNEGDARVLSGVADGELSSSSTDAINGSQLYKVSQDIEGVNATVAKIDGNITTLDGNVSQYLGGGADVLKGTAPTYSIHGEKHNSVGSAFAGVDSSLTDLYKQIDEVESRVTSREGGDKLVEQDPESQLITIGKDVEGDKISIANNEGDARVLSGVADGELSSSSTDAINGSQLYKVSQDIEGVNATVAKIDGNITTFDGNVSQYLGGGADVLKGTAPTYSIHGEKHNNVGSAFAGVDGSLTDLYKQIDEVESRVTSREGGDKLVEQDPESQLITIGKGVEGDKISIANNEGDARVLSGVADGELSSSSTDAINGSQLYKVSQDIEGVNATVAKIDGNITTLDGNVSQYLGGGADVLKGTAPTYSIHGEKHNNVGSAFAGVDGSLTDLYKQIDGVESRVISREGGDKLVEQDPESQLITIGKDVEGDKISIANNEGDVRVLSGVADGELSSSSTDAINGSQLYKVSQDIEGVNATVAKIDGNITTFGGNVSQYLGGGADVLKGTAPTYSIQKKEHNDVGSAFAGVDGSLTDLYKQIDGVESRVISREGGDKLVEQDPESQLITIGKGVEGDKISIANNEGDARVLSGVADGELSSSSTDAINGSQLYKVSQDIEGVNATVAKIDGNITTFDGNVSQYLGGGADVLKGTAPTYSIQKKEHNDVGSAFAGVDGSLTDLYKQIDEVESRVTSREGGDKLVEQDPESQLITIGKGVEGDKISIANNEGDARVLSGVADGELSSSSTDAINGSQLYKVSQDIEGVNATVAKIDGNITTFDGNVSQYLGGGADVLKGTAPTYSIQKKEHNDVGSAFAGVDGSLTDLYKQIDEVESRVTSREGGDKLVEQDPESQLITIGKDVEGDKISIANNEGDARVLSGVADGELSSSSTDAINGSQLYKVSQDIEGVNATVAKIDGNITTFDGNVSQYLGGGADVLKGTAPTYSIHGEKHNSVGSAFAGVDSSLTDLYKQIDEVESRVTSREGGDKLVEQDPESQLITIGKDVEGDKISIANNEGDARVLSGVADGELSSSSTDAINGSQLYKVSQDIEGVNATVAKIDGNITTLDGNVSQYLGGGADVLKGTAPTYSIHGEKHNNVGSAFAGVDGSLTDLYKQIDEVESRVTSREGGDKLVEQDPESQLITIGKDVEGDKISIANNEGDARVLSGVADGELSSSSTDAINGSQLYKVSQDIEGVNAIVTKIDGNITTFDGNVSQYLGGGADVLKGTAPTYSIQKKEHNDVGSAFAGVDGSLTDLYKQIDGVESRVISREGGDKLVEQDPESQLITIGKGVEGDKISIANNEGDVRVLSGVADGELSSSSTDAINGSQLYKVSQDIEGVNATVAKIDRNITTFDGNVSQYLGGGADVLKGTAPTYSIQKKEHNDVGSAFAGVDSSLTDLYKQIDEVESRVTSREGGDKLVEQDPESQLITIGKNVESDKISIANNEGDARVLSGVADGELSSSSTDAINGSQLYSMNNQLVSYLGGGSGYNNGQWTDPTFNVVQFGAKGKSEKQGYHTVADAFEAVNSSMFGLSDRIEHVGNQVGSNSLNWNDDKNAYDANHDGQAGKITNVANGAIEQGSSDAVTGHQLWETNEKIGKVENKVNTFIGAIVSYDKDEYGNKTNTITLAGGSESEPVIIDNVADGKIEEGSKQAINGGQVYDYTKQQVELVLADANKYTDEKIQNIENIEDINNDIITQANKYIDMKFETLNSEVENTKKEARQASAIGLAVSNLHYIDIPGALSIAFGGGVWRGQSALAFGTGYISENGRIRSNLSATTAGGHWGVGAGLRVAFK
ncbi:YadA-like family protein [Bartonella sp. WD16.2]|uniref:YadA-like family protein n=1 Tax=Bartonella sp. WD16.2 TaxID=1933904 RepID=UPI001885FAA1|nr:YadA-like family protein [Bartonella sp. WD16.2]